MTTKKTSATRSPHIYSYFGWREVEVTPRMVRAAVEEIRATASDDEAAHSMEKDLWFEVLHAISSGRAAQPRELCAEALMTSEVDFQRWFA